jgi:DNA mismatch repair protein MutS
VREKVNDDSDGSVLTKDEKVQLSFFQLNDPVLEQIKEQIEKTDIDTLTPVEALIKLNEIKKAIGVK